MGEHPNALMEAAAEVARIAGAVALRHFRSPDLTIDRKANGSPVTNADLAAERAARDWIRARFPDDGILGEEYGIERGDAARRWLLDPIDGTRTFVRGVPLWGALVAVMEGSEVVAGAAAFPATGELAFAARGEGSWLNGERQKVSRVRQSAEALVLTTDETFGALPARKAGWEALSGWAGMSRSWGDCYGYLLVASGRAEAMVDPILSDWDAAALLPIVEEAGGVFTDWSGARRIDGGSAVATNSELAGEVRRLLATSEGREDL
jgi:histidinol phosphatase-like enzyme (inositol monophosphatase family)